MLEEKMYQERFANQNFRKKLWEILVKDFFQKFFQKSDTVLDLACGYGEFINVLSCFKKYGLDKNRDAKKFLKKDVVFLHAAATKIPLKNASVDKIFISNFFEHITKNASIQVVRECKRILKKNGHIIILQPNIRFCEKDYWRFFDHITPIDDRALEELFSLFNMKKTWTILKFLPYTTNDITKNVSFFLFLTKIYIHMPLFWMFFGEQTLLVFSK